MKKETVIVESNFDAKKCSLFCLIFYVFVFFVILGIFSSIGEKEALFIAPPILTLVYGGILHFIVFLCHKNNSLTLSTYRIVGTYRKNQSINIPLDSITSVSTTSLGGIIITCAGNNYKISFLKNQNEFCKKLNELLAQRTFANSNNSKIIDSDVYKELTSLKELLNSGVITQDEFDTKKKKLLEL